MSDYTNRELMEAIYDVRDRVTRIEEGLKRTDKFEDKIDESYDKAIEAKDIAEDALSLAQKNKEDIQSMKVGNRWFWGTAVAVVGVVGTFLGIK